MELHYSPSIKSDLYLTSAGNYIFTNPKSSQVPGTVAPRKRAWHLFLYSTLGAVGGMARHLRATPAKPASAGYFQSLKSDFPGKRPPGLCAAVGAVCAASCERSETGSTFASTKLAKTESHPPSPHCALFPHTGCDIMDISYGRLPSVHELPHRQQ